MSLHPLQCWNVASDRPGCQPQDAHLVIESTGSMVVGTGKLIDAAHNWSVLELTIGVWGKSGSATRDHMRPSAAPVDVLISPLPNVPFH
jgi:hypothetical protein